ncbi:hypothetical protein CCAX7_41800 [Capsulimonas corticalis]|uniref:Uncharacterized protein n=1 Tax=Capsulimonas corticalis TaxID=2219043 RepID=A0A402CXY7_9BACT|nr:ankyrin repeat domain-containing protein [Capsulimonas corticalis]BDI32129.1 hypothetical protein CCAX7_41800 [Capsulimonas corticalis]
MPQSHDIFNAIRGGDLSRVQALLDGDPSASDARNSDGVTPLVSAVYQGQDAIVQELIQRRPPTDIWEAAAVGTSSVITREIEQDPNIIHQTSPDGWLPLHLACFFGHPGAA